MPLHIIIYLFSTLDIAQLQLSRCIRLYVLLTVLSLYILTGGLSGLKVYIMRSSSLLRASFNVYLDILEHHFLSLVYNM